MDCICSVVLIIREIQLGKYRNMYTFGEEKNWFVLLPATDTFPKHDKFSCVDHPEKYG